MYLTKNSIYKCNAFVNIENTVLLSFNIELYTVSIGKVAHHFVVTFLFEGIEIFKVHNHLEGTSEMLQVAE